MNKRFKVILFALILIVPVLLFAVARNKTVSDGLTVDPTDNKLNSAPKVALIFDDLGERMKDMTAIHSLDIPVTIAVIPGLKFSKNIAHIASRCGYTVFIHLPIAPINEAAYYTTKYKFLSPSMSNKQLRLLTKYYLSSIRIASGVNNHMGSLGTTDQRLMKILLKEVKSRNLMFVDSKTTAKSIAYEMARQMDIPSAENSLFIDDSDDEKLIRKQVSKIYKLARQKGAIVVIAHPHKKTFKILKELIPDLKNKIDFLNMKDFSEL